MQVKLKKQTTFPAGCTLNALIRKVGDPWPDSVRDFQKLQEQDKAGAVILRLAQADTLRELLVLSIEAESDINHLQKSFKDFFPKLLELKVKEPNAWLTTSFSEHETLQITKCLILGDNKFDLYLNSGYKNTLETAEEFKKEKKITELSLWVEAAEVQKIEKEANNLAAAIAHTRELVNQPHNKMRPADLAKEAKKKAEECGFEIEVYGTEEIKAKGLWAFWNVAKGSDNEPQLIVMRYLNNPDSQEKLGLVGKGLCYDSGGYDVKSGEGMRTMNCDMAGAAAVIGAISALARAKAKVNVVAIVAACENMISGHAYCNGDIIPSLAGKSIEIVSTDAEGRLTLADAVTYAWQAEKVSSIVDIATLTGAVYVALGSHITGCIADSDQLYTKAEAASKLCGDKIWRLPIDEEYEEKNKSERADIKNGGERGGSSITAGLFVRAFANNVPFLHLDIAGTSYNLKGSDKAPQGASGVGTELLYYLSKEFFA